MNVIRLGRKISDYRQIDNVHQIFIVRPIEISPSNLTHSLYRKHSDRATNQLKIKKLFNSYSCKKNFLVYLGSVYSLPFYNYLPKKLRNEEVNKEKWLRISILKTDTIVNCSFYHTQKLHLEKLLSNLSFLTI